ncbi:MAG: pirin family protein [Nocardioides sp.]
MTNPDRDPDEVRLATGDTDCGLEVLTPRDVPLGGPRAMRVRRTLPQRHRSLIGAWCFADHYGPDLVADTGGMSVAPHPHTGLQTVSWLFTGEIEHRDSAGNHARVRPGEVNLMTGGRGISHSEVSTPGTSTLHGVQLWVALPDADRDTAPGFVHHVPDPVTGEGWEARVFLGSLLGETSPVPTYTSLLGAELLIEPGATAPLALDDGFEHGLLVDTGVVGVDGREVKQHELGYLAPGRDEVDLTAGSEPVRLLVLGGEPFGGSIVMWWNFVGRDHDEIVAFRDEWQRQITRDGTVVGDSQDVADGRFGVVVGDHLPPIPAPALPNARLKERR